MADPVQLGPYLLRAPIGVGGMGTVWRADHGPSGETVAVKLLTPSRGLSLSHVSAMRHEIRAMARLRHPAIARVLDHGDVDEAAASKLKRVIAGSPYVVLELLDGGTLAHDRPAPWSVVVRLLDRLLSALAHAHAHGLIHRDLKPANVLRSSVAHPWDVQLADFGIAQAQHGIDASRKTRGGTPRYMPPEQASSDWRDQGPHTDLYALGRLALFLLTGTPRGLAAPGPQVPVGFEDWLSRMLSPTVEGRYAVAADSRYALSRLADATVSMVARDVSEAWTSNATMPLSTIDEPLPAWADEGITAPVEVPRPAPFTSDWRRPGPPASPHPLSSLSLFRLRHHQTVGRVHEREQLWTTLRRVHGGQSEAIVLRGPPGIGVHHLADWFCVRAHELGCARILRGRASDHSDGLSDALDSWLRCGQLRDLALHDRMSVLSARVGGNEPIPTQTLVQLMAQQHGGKHRRADWARVIATLSKRRPVVVWIDRATSEHGRLLKALQDANARALLLLTPEQPDTLGELPELRLHALTLAQCTQLCAQMARLSPELRDELAGVVEGHPGRLIDTLAQWIEAGQLQRTRTGLQLVHAERRKFAQLDSSWGDRLARLLQTRSARDRVTLELASCAGMDVDLPAWHQCCRASGLEISPDLLHALIAAGLAEQPLPDGRWHFANQRVRRALIEGAIRAGRNAQHHRVWALWWRDNTDNPGRQGQHWLDAGDPMRAAPLLLDGAQRAHAQSSFAICERLLGRLEQAIAGDALPQIHALRAATALLEIRLNINKGQLERAEQLARSLEERAHEPEWGQWRASARWVRGRLALFRGQHTLSRQLLHLARDWARDNDHPLTLARAWFDLGQLSVQRGKLPDARDEFAKAQQQYQRVPYLQGVALAASFVAQVEVEQNRLPQARIAAEQAYAAALLAGGLRVEANHALLSGTIAHRAGDLDQALEQLRRAVHLHGPETSIGASALINLATVLDKRGDTRRVWPALHRGLNGLKRMKRWRLIGAGYAIGASASADLGDAAMFDSSMRTFAERFVNLDHTEVDVADTLLRAHLRCLRQGWSTRAALTLQLSNQVRP